MMVPPVIRMGVPPMNPDHRKRGYVVLVDKRGWIIVKWSQYHGVLEDQDRHIPAEWRLIPADNVLCWMPEDGS